MRNKISYYFSKFLKKIYLPAIKNSNIHETSRVCSASHVIEVEMGKYSYIGNNCTVIDVKIENFCSIGDNVIIGGASHPIDWVSTSPVFHEGNNIMKKNFSTHNFKTTKQTIIKNDVWIGNNVLIKSGVKIENGAVIGMGAVVTKDVGPYEIWGGNPAKLIRKRFEEDQINELLKINWWNWDDIEIEKKSEKINKVFDFVEKEKKDEIVL